MFIWFQQIIRTFFFTIDINLYELIIILYNFIIDISRTTILSQGQIKEFAERIQMLLGVFMLFKVAMSLITYVVNPDEFSDKSKGFAKLWQNAIISLIMLILTPYIFGMAYDLQNLLLEKNTLATLIMGGESDNEFLNTGGQQLAYSSMIPFFRPNSGLSNLDSCSTLFDSNDNTMFNDSCKASMLEFLGNESNKDIVVGNYTTGVEKRNFYLTFKLETANANHDGEFLMDYKILLSTASAIVIALIMITFCMDVALRSVKLAFLQLISPIPIISYIDPKSGKDGMFKKWYQMCFSTYLSLFVRLLALYFGLYIINQVIETGFINVLTGEKVDSAWINLIMIIGVLMFVKQLPKILEGFGIKLDGGGKFQLNPFKKIDDEVLGGKQIRGAVAGAGAAGLAGLTNFNSRFFNGKTWRDENGDVNLRTILRGARKVAGSTIAGTTSASFRATRKIIKGENAGKIFTNSMGEAMFAKLNREDALRKAGLENAGVIQRAGFALGAFGADVARWTGNLNAGQREYLEADEQDKRISKLQNDNAELKVAQEKLRQDKFSAFEEIQGIGKNIDTLLENNSAVKTAKTAWENAKARGDSDEVIEKLRQAYKLKKAEILKDENAKVDSAIHNQVELYNQLRNKAISDGKITTAQASKFANLSTDIKFKADTNGSFVTVGTDYYEIRTDVHGVEYYIDSSGSRIYKSDWSSMGAVRSKVDKSGVSIIGDNDDMIAAEKITFETSADYKNYSDKIKANEQSIESIKASNEYVQAHNENSRAKLQNSSRFGDQVQQPGYKPSAGDPYTPYRGVMPTPPFGRGTSTPPSSGGSGGPGGGSGGTP